MSDAASPARHRVRTVLLVLLGLVAAAIVGVAWYFADQLTLPPTFGPWERDTSVLAVEGDVVTLPADGFAAQTGVWGLELPADGHVVLTEQLSAQGATVTWRFTDVVGAGPAPGDLARIDEYVWDPDPSALGLPFDEVTVAGPLGDLPAWWVPADGEPVGTVVFVHGRGATRQEALRFLPTLVAAGWDVLVTTYRGDDGAPPLEDNRLLYGAREWEDLEAALRHVDTLREGPTVVFASSMGASLTAQLLDRSTLADDVDAVVLDSPLLSMDVLLGLQAGLNGIPPWAEPVLLPVVQLIADVRFGLESSTLEQADADETFDLPVLLVHGDADGFVPFGPSRDLAGSSDTVTWFRVPQADHLRSWNLDPEGYERALRTFLDGVGAS